MSGLWRAERGVAAVELALCLPLVALLVFGAVPLWGRATVTGDLHRAAWEGMRYAVKVRPNPTDDVTYACSTATSRITRRHTVDEIVAETRRAASHLLGSPDVGIADDALPGDVTVFVDGVPYTSGTITCTVPANAQIRVEVVLTRPAGAAAAVANSLSAFFGNPDGVFADPYTVTVDAVGVLE